MISGIIIIVGIISIFAIAVGIINNRYGKNFGKDREKMGRESFYEDIKGRRVHAEIEDRAKEFNEESEHD